MAGPTNHMFLQSIMLNKDVTVSEIVSKDYRTADVFRKYGIEYCCGGKQPLHTACEVNGLDTELVLSELLEATRDVKISSADIDFNDWDIDFLTDYIVNVHHRYIRRGLPQLKDHLDRFAEGHKKKFEYVEELQRSVNQFSRTVLVHMEQEEEIIFPYIRQIAHAYHSRASYASLLVRTLRKPVDDIMQHEHDVTAKMLRRWREITNNYTVPSHACVSHQVVFKKFREVDNEIVQHLFLENNILFPKAINMEKELLHTNNEQDSF
jgi:regulator of cell morphogenesis and NO signaling